MFDAEFYVKLSIKRLVDVEGDFKSTFVLKLLFLFITVLLQVITVLVSYVVYYFKGKMY